MVDSLSTPVGTVEAIGRMILDGPGEWIGSGEQLHELASLIAARVRSEAGAEGAAEERQRIAQGLAMTRSLGDRPALLQYVDRLIDSSADGCVPVATPAVAMTRDDSGCGWVAYLTLMPWCRGLGSTRVDALADLAEAMRTTAAEPVLDALASPSAGPVATPAEPLARIMLERAALTVESAAHVRTEAVAEERQRIASAIEGERRSTPDADEYSVGYDRAIENCLRVARRAAGSTATRVSTVRLGPDVPAEAVSDGSVPAEQREQESAGALLARLGADATEWVAEFVRAVDRLADEGEPILDPTPGSWLHGWFCSAIEAGRTAGAAAEQRRIAELVRATVVPDDAEWSDNVEGWNRALERVLQELRAADSGSEAGGG